MMEVIFLGVAGSTSVKNHNTISFLVENLLFDCGEGITRALQEINAINKIDYVFITHTHADHFVGLIPLLWYYMLTKRKNKLVIVGPAGIRELTISLLKMYSSPLERILKWLEFKEIKPGDKVGPVTSGEAKHSIPALAYRVDLDRSLCYTGDTTPTDNIIELAKNCDLLIHDATYPSGLEKEAIADWHTAVRDAAIIADKANAKMLALVHLPFYYYPNEEFTRAYIEAARKYFKGEVFIPEELKIYRI